MGRSSETLTHCVYISQALSLDQAKCHTLFSINIFQNKYKKQKQKSKQKNVKNKTDTDTDTDRRQQHRFELPPEFSSDFALFKALFTISRAPTLVALPSSNF